MKTNKKYDLLLNDTIQHEGRTLYRIVALRDFGREFWEVKAGDLGGYIENESNLSHEGNCWVFDKAMVFENAKVLGNSEVHDQAKISGTAHIKDSSRIYNEAEISGDAYIYGEAYICDNAKVSGNVQIGVDAYVYGAAEVCGEARINGSARVYGYAKISGNAHIFECAEVFGNSIIEGNAGVWGNVHIGGKSKIGGDVSIYGETEIYDAEVYNDDEYITFKNWWSSCRYFTWTKSNNMWSVGCFRGTGEELIAKAYKDSEKSGREYERVVKFVESILQDDLEEGLGE